MACINVCFFGAGWLLFYNILSSSLQADWPKEKLLAFCSFRGESSYEWKHHKDIYDFVFRSAAVVCIVVFWTGATAVLTITYIS